MHYIYVHCQWGMISLCGLPHIYRYKWLYVSVSNWFKELSLLHLHYDTCNESKPIDYAIIIEFFPQWNPMFRYMVHTCANVNGASDGIITTMVQFPAACVMLMIHLKKRTRGEWQQTRFIPMDPIYTRGTGNDNCWSGEYHMDIDHTEEKGKNERVRHSGAITEAWVILDVIFHHLPFCIDINRP